jgi:uncharacterized membrane protein YcaP (DUF421 family)
MDIIEELFGSGKDLSVLQMCCRSFVIFLITLILIRLGGMRAFGKKSAFDNIIVIMLGAILSRAVTGASAFVPTVMASLVLVLIHRVLGILCLFSQPINRFAKGESRSLYKNGEINRKNMKRSLLTENELLESVRLQANERSFTNIDEIIIEATGEISVVKKKPA